MIAIPRFGMRCDLVLSEVAHDFAEGLVFVAQIELHGSGMVPRAWR